MRGMESRRQGGHLDSNRHDRADVPVSHEPWLESGGIKTPILITTTNIYQN